METTTRMTTLELKRLMEGQTNTIVEQNNVISGWHCFNTWESQIQEVMLQLMLKMAFILPTSAMTEMTPMSIELTSVLRNVREAVWLILSWCIWWTATAISLLSADNGKHLYSLCLAFSHPCSWEHFLCHGQNNG